jgi:hypothetical protein
MKITQGELYNMLFKFEGTTIVRIHAITPQNGDFHAGIGGSRFKADSMFENIGVSANDIKKEQWASVLLTSCTYGQLVKNVVTGAIDKDLKELGVELTSQDKKQLSEGLEEYEVSARKNGTTINSYLAVSSKDGKGMITVYRSVKGNERVQFLHENEVINKNDPNSKFAPYFKTTEKGVSKKQAEYAERQGVDLKKFLITNNFRLDRIKDIKINGIEYEIE